MAGTGLPTAEAAQKAEQALENAELSAEKDHWAVEAADQQFSFIADAARHDFINNIYIHFTICDASVSRSSFYKQPLQYHLRPKFFRLFS